LGRADPSSNLGGSARCSFVDAVEERYVNTDRASLVITFRESTMGKRKNKRIIDFRVRPPLVPFKILFDLKLRRLTWENKFNITPRGRRSSCGSRVSSSV
jgi:hypothetical protein